MKRRWLAFLLPAMTLGLFSCQSGASEVTGIAFVQNVYNLEVGEQITLNVVLMGGKKDVAFISTNESVLTVDGQGVATGIAKGEATVLAICNDHIARCTVTVMGNGLSTGAVYQRTGTLSLHSSSPALGLTGEAEIPLTYAYEESGTRRYAEASMPKGALLSGLASLYDAPFFVENPSVSLGEGYNVLSEAAKKTETGPLILKALRGQEINEAHLYDGDTYIDRLSLETSFDGDWASYLVDLLGDIPSLDNPEAIITYLLTRFSEDPKLAFAIFTNLTYDQKEEGGLTTFTVTIDDGANDAILERLSSYELGDAAFTEAHMETITKEGTLQRVSLSLKGTLYGEENDLSLSLSVNEDKEELPADYFKKLEESFKRK